MTNDTSPAVAPCCSADDATIASILVEHRLCEYDNLLPAEWCKSFSAAIQQAKELEAPGLRLVMQWRAATRVAELPATMMYIFSEFANGVLLDQALGHAAEPLANSFASAFRDRAPSLARKPLFSGAFHHATRMLRAKLEQADAIGRSTVVPEEVWRQFYDNKPFRFRLWASMQVSVVAAFNAYEGFVAEVAGPRIGNEGLDDRVSRCLGEPMYDRLLKTQEINVARLLRHAISHNQGRCTSKLSALKHGLAQQDGLISVFPGDIRRFIWAMGTAATDVVKFIASRNGDAATNA
jgi:hypothetical protein